MSRAARRRAHPRRAVAVLAALALGVATAGCTPAPDPAAAQPTTERRSADLPAFFDPDVLHTIAVEVDPAAVNQAIATYLATGEKEWLTATVTLDGQTFTDVGLRLKGNSTLREVSAESAAEDLPWLIRLDKQVEQDLGGVTSVVVRGSSTETALNEALAQQLVAAAGLAAQAPAEVALRFNDGPARLRLVVENPDDAWMQRWLSTEGSLFKAETGGDWSDRGTDPDAYDDVFEPEAGAEDFTALTDLLAWLAGDDAAFEAELAERVDVDALTTYLAVQELIANIDDIDGPGNNSYLWFDRTGQLTVVSWDLNLAFGTANVGDPSGVVPGQQPPGGQAPGRQPPGGQAPGRQPPGGPGAGPPGPGPGGNVLVERFLADPQRSAAVDAEVERLRTELVDSGLAAELLADWSAMLTDQAADLVDPDVVASEAAAVAAYL